MSTSMRSSHWIAGFADASNHHKENPHLQPPRKDSTRSQMFCSSRKGTKSFAMLHGHISKSDWELIVFARTTSGGWIWTTIDAQAPLRWRPYSSISVPCQLRSKVSWLRSSYHYTKRRTHQTILDSSGILHRVHIYCGNGTATNTFMWHFFFNFHRLQGA
jgi:hypothetical protein